MNLMKTQPHAMELETVTNTLSRLDQAFEILLQGRKLLGLSKNKLKKMRELGLILPKQTHQKLRDSITFQIKLKMNEMRMMTLSKKVTKNKRISISNMQRKS